MELIWDETKKEEFIKLCINSLNKTKKTQIEFKWLETWLPSEGNKRWDEPFYWIGTTVYGSGIYTYSTKIFFADIYKLLEHKIKNGRLNLDILDKHSELELGKLIINKIWTGVTNRIEDNK